MNAREVLQALLDGKTVSVKYPRWRPHDIRLKGNDIEHTVVGTWEDTETIPSMSLRFVSIKEEEE